MKMAIDEKPSNVVPMPARPARLRSDVPPFNPSNPAHLRAWEGVWDFTLITLAHDAKTESMPMVMARPEIEP